MSPTAPIPREPGRAWQRRLAPYLFLLPFLLLFFVFQLYPLLRSLLLSFHRGFGTAGPTFVGLDNYRFLLRDRLFHLAVFNTLLFTAGFLVLQIPLSLGLALLLNGRRVRARSLFRFAFFAPYLVGPVFVAVLFSVMLAPRRGLLAQALARMAPGVEVNFLTDPRLGMLSVLIASLWLSAGYGMIYFLAALQAVDRDLYDAAALDGAGRWGRFCHITLPGVRPVLLFLLLVGTIAALQLFELPFVLFQGAGPGGSALTIVMYLYLAGWEAGDLGYASAIGWALVLLIIGIAAIQLRVAGAGRRL